MIPAVLIVVVLGALLSLKARRAVRLPVATCGFAILTQSLRMAHTSPFAASGPPHSAHDVWLRGVVFAWWLLAAGIAADVQRWLSGYDARSREARLVSDLVSAAIALAAVLAILSFVLDLPIRGLLATSGVLAVVLGLALQNTLADVFSGIAVGIEGAFRVGDTVALADGTEGVVVGTNWRAIRIETYDGDVATVPNSIVAKSHLVNRSRPTPRRRGKAEFSWPATVPPPAVIEAVRHAFLLTPKILAEPAPSVSFTRLGARINDFSASFHVSCSDEIGAARTLLLEKIGRLLPGPREQRRAATSEAGPAEVRDLLRGVALFEPLSDAILVSLANTVKQRTLEPGETLFREGQADDTLYIVERGVLEVSKRENGSAILVGRIGAGDYVGEVGLLTGSPHAATSIAVTRCRISQLPREALADLIAASPDLMHSLQRSAQDGLDLIERSVAASASPRIREPGQFLALLRSVFHIGREDAGTR